MGTYHNLSAKMDYRAGMRERESIVEMARDDFD